MTIQDEINTLYWGRRQGSFTPTVTGSTIQDIINSYYWQVHPYERINEQYPQGCYIDEIATDGWDIICYGLDEPTDVQAALGGSFGAWSITITYEFSAEAVNAVIERSVDGGAFAALTTQTPPLGSYVDSPLATDALYQYRVKLVYADRESEFVNTSPVTAFINLSLTYDNRYHLISI